MINLLTPNTKVVAKRELTWRWHGIPRQAITGLPGIVIDPSSQTVSHGEALVRWNHLSFGEVSVVRACDVSIVQ